MGDLAALSKMIKKNIKAMRNYIRSAYSESCKSGVISPPTVDAVLTLYPECTTLLCSLAEAGISWNYLLRYSELDRVRFTSRDIIVPKSAPRSSKLEQRLYFIVSKIKSLFEEISKYGDMRPYVSRDLFCTVYSDGDDILEKLEKKHINWTTLLHMAGIPFQDILSSETRRQAAISCKTFMEAGGITVRHLQLLQKLIVDLRHEDPERMDRILCDTLNLDSVNDKFYTYTLAKLSEIINYLNSVA